MLLGFCESATGEGGRGMPRILAWEVPRQREPAGFSPPGPQKRRTRLSDSTAATSPGYEEGQIGATWRKNSRPEAQVPTKEEIPLFRKRVKASPHH